MITHIIDEGAWIVFLTVIGITLAMHTFLSNRLIYDTTPPITNLTQIPLVQEIKAGETLKYVAAFDKRPDCKVTEGGYNITGDTTEGARYSVLNFKTTTTGTWPSGKRQKAVSGVTIPADTPPGDYAIWWRYCWQCKGARRVMCVPETGSIETSIKIKVR